MATKSDETCVYAWRRLSYPLWQHDRPQLETFGAVSKMLDQMCPFVVRTNLEELERSGERKVWLEWLFDGPINEKLRMRMQEHLASVFEEHADSFRWEGSRAKTEIATVIAMGPHLQQ